MGNSAVMNAGDVQRISAGGGIYHSEYNNSPAQPVHLIQVWMLPDRKGVQPRYDEKAFGSVSPGRFVLVASSSGRDGSIPIYQDAELYLAKVEPGQTISQPLDPDRYGWLHLAEGSLSVNGERYNAGDGAAIAGEKELNVSGHTASQVLFFSLA